MSEVLIVGYGVVGQNLARELQALHPDIYDKYKPEVNTKREIVYDVAFICVDTPYNERSANDLTEVKKAIEENIAFLYVMKSTVLPGTCEQLYIETGRKVVFSPEYYGGTQHCNNFDFPFTIVGGRKEDCITVVQLLQACYDARHTFRIVDARTAELVKYMENAWLATKVSFVQQFYEIAKQTGVSYEELRELFILDPRVNPAHTFVYSDNPFWESHCLDKDVPAIAEAYNAPLLKAVISFNDLQKKRYKIEP